MLLGGNREVLDDERARECTDKWVAIHVQAVGLESRQAVLVCELVLGVSDLRLHRTARESALADDVHVLATLTDVGGHGDDFGAGLLLDPFNGNGCVQPTAVGQDDSFLHCVLLCSAIRSSDVHSRVAAAGVRMTTMMVSSPATDPTTPAWSVRSRCPA